MSQKVFLPKRADTKKFLPGIYELPGGHLDFGEDIEAGLKREIDEEFGRQVTLGDPFSAFTYANQIKGSHTVEVIYFARFVGSIDTIHLNPEDHSGYDWFSKEDVVNRKSEILAEEFNSGDDDEPEYQTILKGFRLLEGNNPNFG